MKNEELRMKEEKMINNSEYLLDTLKREREFKKAMQKGYRDALKQEKDREYIWRHTRQGQFESSFASLDALKEQFDDPGKIAIFSDSGAGASRIRAFNLSEEEAQVVDEALSKLSESDRKFARAVICGETWRDLGYEEKSYFYKRIKNICKKLASQ